jgi:ABC-2 type transport system permease protein
MVKENSIIQTNKRKDLSALLALMAIIVLINFVGSFYFKRFDLTSEKRYTLSESTKALLKNIDDEVFFKIYFEGNFNPSFTRLKNEAKEILDQFRAYSGRQIQYEFIDPAEEGLTAAEKDNIQKQLYEKGLVPEEVIERSVDKTSSFRIWPGAVVSYKGREAIWQIFTRQIGFSSEQSINNSVQELEFSLSNTIRKLQRTKKPEVTFIEGHNELDTVHKYDLSNALSEYYFVNRTIIRPGTELSALKGSDAIIVAKPDSAFSDKEKFAIDQFIMEGGKVLWLIDPVSVDMDTLRLKGYSLGLERPLNLEDMLFKYGVRLNSVLVQDMQCAQIPINIGFKKGEANLKLFPWVYSVLVLPAGNHPIVKNLDLIKFDYLSTLDTISVKGIKKTILLNTSRTTKLQPVPARIALGSAVYPIKESQFRESFKPIACLLEGSFSSFVEFRRLPSRLQEDTLFKFIQKGKPTKMIVVADGDIARNDFQRSTGMVMPLGYDKYSKQTYANKTFLLNCVNYLLDDEGMLQLRSREVKLRLLDKKKIKQQRTKWQMINVLGPLGLLVFVGFVQFYYRKRKYAV